MVVCALYTEDGDIKKRIFDNIISLIGQNELKSPTTNQFQHIYSSWWPDQVSGKVMNFACFPL